MVQGNSNLASSVPLCHSTRNRGLKGGGNAMAVMTGNVRDNIHTGEAFHGSPEEVLAPQPHSTCQLLSVEGKAQSPNVSVCVGLQLS